MDFKDFHIGSLICQHITECGIEIARICNFFKCSEKEVDHMYKSKNLNTEVLLKWSKLLEYDFFRIYSQHLILYAPPSDRNLSTNRTSSLPRFRKSIYTKEIIDFILDQIVSEEMTRLQVMERYKIPKTTLYRWIAKYGTQKF